MEDACLSASERGSSLLDRNDSMKKEIVIQTSRRSGAFLHLNLNLGNFLLLPTTFEFLLPC